MRQKPTNMSCEELEDHLALESRRYELFMYNTSKKILWLIIIFGVIWISLSYVLAFQDKIQIAESLSSNVCNVVIGTVIVYFITKTIENISKYGFVGKKRANDHDGGWKRRTQHVDNGETADVSSAKAAEAADYFRRNFDASPASAVTENSEYRGDAP